MKRIKRVEVRTFLWLPIYEAQVQLIVAEDIYAERDRPDQVTLFGECHCRNGRAMCSFSGEGNFALFFTPSSLTHSCVGHELFHLAHRIMEWAGVRTDPENQESGALLTGYLHDWFYATVGERVSRSPQSVAAYHENHRK